jgi:hypothetical protein
MVLWCLGAMVQWCNGAMVLGCHGAMVPWCSGGPVLQHYLGISGVVGLPRLWERSHSLDPAWPWSCLPTTTIITIYHFSRASPQGFSRPCTVNSRRATTYNTYTYNRLLVVSLGCFDAALFYTICPGYVRPALFPDLRGKTRIGVGGRSSKLPKQNKNTGQGNQCQT